MEIEGVTALAPIEHAIVADRLEAGALFLAAAITGGEIYLPQAPAHDGWFSYEIARNGPYY